MPQRWTAIWDGPQSSLQYIRAFARKANAMRRWIGKAQDAQILKEPISLADLFHPETFLSAFRQRSARALKRGIDDLKLIASFEEHVIKATNVIAVKELLLQGCQMDGGRLTDQSENKIELQVLPYCYLAWQPREEEGAYSVRITSEVPVYFGLGRESLLCQLSLPQVGDANDKVISGAAIFLQGIE